jgi:hypothetical protein
MLASAKGFVPMAGKDRSIRIGIYRRQEALLPYLPTDIGALALRSCFCIKELRALEIIEWNRKYPSPSIGTKCKSLFQRNISLAIYRVLSPAGNSRRYSGSHHLAFLTMRT